MDYFQRWGDLLEDVDDQYLLFNEYLLQYTDD